MKKEVEDNPSPVKKRRISTGDGAEKRNIGSIIGRKRKERKKG
jgi:hypothetical protein